MPRISRRPVEPLAYSVAETAALGVSQDSVRRLIIGRCVIPIRAIEAYLDRAEFRQVVASPTGATTGGGEAHR